MKKGCIPGILLLYLSSTSALICLSCNHVADVRECLELKECKPNQKCFSNFALDQHGKGMYTLGCTDQFVCNLTPDNMVGKRSYSSRYNSVEDLHITKNVRGVTSNACLQCCNNTDGCNRDLCATTNPKHIRCMTCSNVTETKLCGTVNECGSDEVCFIHRGIRAESGKHFYELGCIGAQQCKASQQNSFQNCLSCCYNSDFCNIVGCKPPFVSTTTHTSPTYQVIIHGLDKGRYNSNVVLTCVTTPSAQTYTWKFNGTSTLPEGVAFQSASSQAGLNVLFITNLNESKFGTYKCVASIDGRTVEQDHFIGIIKERPTVSIVKSTVSSNFAIQCKTTGYPIPEIGWTFTSERTGLHGIPPDVQYTTKPFLKILYVFNYRPLDHNGLWRCTAKNSEGITNATVHVP